MVRTIAYWASTIIAAAMLGFALSYLTGSAQVVAGFNHLGYPQYLRIVLGVAKPAAAVVLLLPERLLHGRWHSSRIGRRVTGWRRSWRWCC